MKKLNGKRQSLKFYFIALMIFTFTVGLYAYKTGMTGKTNLNGGIGCYCHNGSPSSDVTVSIIGPDQLEVNETADYQVEITGGPLVRGGVDIAASDGILVPGDLLQLLAGELTHKAPVDAADNKVTFAFQYTAPASAGNITLYATGNSVNGNGANSGDMWNHAPDKQVTINNPPVYVEGHQPEIPGRFALDQNYPNPFNPNTIIPYSIDKAEFVTLTVYDLLGKEVLTLFEGYSGAGGHSISLNASDLKSGTYIYRLTAGGKSQMKKMIVLK